MMNTNKLFKWIVDLPPILPDIFTSILCLSIQPSPQKKKTKIQLDCNLSSKWLNYAKEKLEDQSKNFEKKWTIVIHSNMWDNEQWKGHVF